MEDITEYLRKFLQRENETLNEKEKNRMHELSGIKESKLNNRFAIQVFVETDNSELILEHEQYKKFKKSTDLYYYHPEDKHIPVKAHYHIVNSKSKKEIYAVNTDGTAHHKKNKGIVVPKKHAKELKLLGVNFKNGNILESLTINESVKNVPHSFLIIIEE